MLRNIDKKTQKIFCLTLITILFFSCTKDDDVEPGAEKCYITGVRINSFPTSDNGAQWDISIGDDQYADPTFSISNTDEILYEHATPLSDIKVENLPAQLNMSSYFLPSMDQDYGVFIYDYDVTSADDFIGGGYFNPNDYNIDQPTFVNIATDNINIDVFVKWE